MDLLVQVSGHLFFFLEDDEEEHAPFRERDTVRYRRENKTHETQRTNAYARCARHTSIPQGKTHSISLPHPTHTHTCVRHAGSGGCRGPRSRGWLKRRRAFPPFFLKKRGPRNERKLGRRATLGDPAAVGILAVAEINQERKATWRFEPPGGPRRRRDPAMRPRKHRRPSRVSPAWQHPGRLDARA